MKKKEQMLELGSLIPIWKELFLTPNDYAPSALFDKQTRALMELIEFEHGGEAYDSKYPEGIPTSLKLEIKGGKTCDSGFVMFPVGHAR